MTRTEARHEIARLTGGEPTTIIGAPHIGSVWKFRSTADADHCKAVLDALDPDFTGEVFGFARLMIASPQET